MKVAELGRNDLAPRVISCGNRANTMPSFFSGIDDNYELGDPGIHLVVGDIKISENKYTIAASVVGSGRRFEMHFSNLIDATPISGVEFHPKVIDYVDYTSPLTKKTTGTTSSYATWSKNVSKSQNYSDYYSDNYQEYQSWLEKAYGVTNSDVSDPYHYSEGNYNYGGGKSTSKNSIKLWEIEDLLTDYAMENSDDVNKLRTLADTLKSQLKDLEDFIVQNLDEIPF